MNTNKTLNVVQSAPEVRTTQPVAYVSPAEQLAVVVSGRIMFDLSAMTIKVMLVKNGTLVSFKPLGNGLNAFHVPKNAAVVGEGQSMTALDLYNLAK